MCLVVHIAHATPSACFLHFDWSVIELISSERDIFQLCGESCVTLQHDHLPFSSKQINSHFFGGLLVLINCQRDQVLVFLYQVELIQRKFALIVLVPELSNWRGSALGRKVEDVVARYIGDKCSSAHHETEASIMVR